MDQADCNLAGAGILVTRATHQAAGLCQLIEELKGRPLCLPAIEISAPAHTEQLSKILAQIETFDLAIFISANAVRWALKYLPGGRLPEKIEIAAVGLATAQALAATGHRVAVVPAAGFDSEALLATPELSGERVVGKRILVFRGQEGRQLLGDTLVRRGAQLVYAEVYRRSCPEPAGDLRQARWLENLDVITATSTEVLDNLFKLFGYAQRERLQRTPLIVVSERMRDHARARGCRQVILASRPDDRSIVEAVCRWLSNR